jgi:hypothetical protein
LGSGFGRGAAATALVRKRGVFGTIAGLYVVLASTCLLLRGFDMAVMFFSVAVLDGIVSFGCVRELRTIGMSP